MTTESFLALACAGLIAFLFGLGMTFAGYKFFLVLLPIWGFFFGLWLGAQSIQALFGVGFLSTVTSWVVGFLVGAIFAVLSYFFWLFAVAILGGSLGYYPAVGLLQWIGLDMGILVWLIGIVAGIALAAVVSFFNLQKWLSPSRNEASDPPRRSPSRPSTRPGAPRSDRGTPHASPGGLP